jgi:hypothetical protein
MLEKEIIMKVGSIRNLTKDRMAGNRVWDAAQNLLKVYVINNQHM